MRLGREIEFRRSAPAARLDVVLGTLSYRHRLVRNVRDSRQQVAQASFVVGRYLLQILDLVAEIFGLRHRAGRVLTALLEFADLLRSPIALRLEGFGLGDGLPPFGIDGLEIL